MLIRVSTLDVPANLSSLEFTVVSGLMLVRLGCGMCDPVITTSATEDPEAGAEEVAACCA